MNNNFLIATSDPRALLYNDKSVLENHHCASAFSILAKPENNFLNTLGKNTFKTVRSHIVEMILATDLSLHFDLLTKFKKKVVTSGTFDPLGNADDKSVLMQVLMKCADVSNPTKEWSLYSEWIDRITAEFHHQGDLEKELGLEVSPFMNRNNDHNGPNAQKGFIEFIVYPLYEALESWSSIEILMHNLNAHREKFCGKTKAPEVEEAKRNRKRINSSAGLHSIRIDPARMIPDYRASAVDQTASPVFSPGRRMSAYSRRPSLVNSVRQLSIFQRSAHSGHPSASIDTPNLTLDLENNPDPFAIEQNPR